VITLKTAKSIAQEIFKLSNSEEVITGDMLNSFSDSQLSETIRNTTIFAQIISEQKLRIVEALLIIGNLFFNIN
jgi:Ca2+-transporting ATPase